MDTHRHMQLMQELNRILDILIMQYHPEKVILFGSLVSGHTHATSDIDLVIIKTTQQRFMDRLIDVALLCNSDMGLDCLVYTPEEINRMLAERNPFILEVYRTGKVIYERQAVATMA